MASQKTNRQRKIANLIVAAIVGSLVIVTLYLRSDPEVELESGYRTVMGTFARVVVVAKDQQTAKKGIDTAFEKLEQVDELMSTYKEDSQISRINRLAYEKPVEVNRIVFELLERSKSLSEKTNGAFDITVGPVVELWKEAGDANSVPSEQALTKARSKTGYDKLLLDANSLTVRFAVEEMKLDLGGIAKGFAIDLAIEAVKDANCAGAMVDAGGDVRVFGKPPRGQQNWSVGLQDPAAAGQTPDSGELLMVFRLKNESVATSGDYQRFELIGGQRYSHIIDTATGKGAGGFSSVSVIAEDATTADALATAVSVLGIEKGLSLIESMEGVEAAVLGKGKTEVIFSEGARKFIRD